MKAATAAAQSRDGHALLRLVLTRMLCLARHHHVAALLLCPVSFSDGPPDTGLLGLVRRLA